MKDNLIDNSIKEDEILKRNIKDEDKKLKNSKVVILGLGGLGSNIAVSLARSGVGHLKLVDFDFVEQSNLNRQYYMLRHIGIEKTEALKSIIKEINPFVDIEVNHIKVDKDNLKNIINDCEIICEAFDNAETKAMLVNEVLNNFEEKYLITGSGMAGIQSSNNIKTVKKFKKLYVCGDEVSDFENVDGMMSPRVNICAGHQSNIILRIIMGLE